MDKNNKDRGESGYFGAFGGRYVPEILVTALEELENNYFRFKDDKDAIKKIHFAKKAFEGRLVGSEG